jgi:hypothetical protein
MENYFKPMAFSIYDNTLAQNLAEKHMQDEQIKTENAKALY